jgi:hypothetical protein
MTDANPHIIFTVASCAVLKDSAGLASIYPEATVWLKNTRIELVCGRAGLLDAEAVLLLALGTRHEEIVFGHEALGMDARLATEPLKACAGAVNRVLDLIVEHLPETARAAIEAESDMA